MPITQIARIQHRRGVSDDLPTLASAELGWVLDQKRLYIGNGTIEEGAPSLGKTEILTQYSILDFESSYTANILALQSNVVLINSNIVSLTNRVTTLEAGTLSYVSQSLSAGASNNRITTITSNNAVINYTLSQGSTVRTGSITVSNSNSIVSFNEDYTETGITDIVFSMNANVTTANLNYTSTNSGNLLYRITKF